MSDRFFARTLELERQRDALIAYLTSKIAACDWHAVQDAASDIRELDARLEELDALDESAHE